MIYLTMSLSCFPGLNFTTLVAGILMGLPVWGLRPSRAFRSDTEKVPNPANAKRP